MKGDLTQNHPKHRRSQAPTLQAAQDTASPPSPTEIGYTLRDAAQVLGISPKEVRSLVQAGFVEPTRGAAGEHRVTFQDLVLLRTAQGLLKTITPRRLRRALRRLKEQLPNGHALTGVRITATGQDLVARDGTATWNPDSGQLLLDFPVDELAAEAAPIVRKTVDHALDRDEGLSAEEWFQLGYEAEAADSVAARNAYEKAIERDACHVDAHVNLGRILHAAGDAAGAESHYRTALAERPDDATARFNLGVALEDLQRDADAEQAYREAIASQPNHGDAHWNLACLLQKRGELAEALRHLTAYRDIQAL